MKTCIYYSIDKNVKQNNTRQRMFLSVLFCSNNSLSKTDKSEEQMKPEKGYRLQVIKFKMMV
jgi:hypothetical protein